jgi:hypothetical protein
MLEMVGKPGEGKIVPTLRILFVPPTFGERTRALRNKDPRMTGA